MRTSRTRWFPLAAGLLSALHGCGKSSPRPAESSDEAGRPAHAGEGASGANAGGEDARGGSTTGGKGGSNAGTGGTSGDVGTAGTGNAGTSGGSGGASGAMGGGTSGGGELGGSAGLGGTEPVSGASGSGGSAGAPVIAPPNWLCESSRYGDSVCDCGCGLIDVDCPSASADDCEACSYEGCSDEACSGLFPDDNSICTTVPWVWSCAERLYNDGAQCDCGCGFRDPDCAENLIAECDRCNGVGSCSGQACPGIIDPSSAERCERPPVPEGWTCEETNYADSYECDCGCGVPDVDCRSNTIESCERCGCGSPPCEVGVDPADTTKCLPPPEEWLCPAEAWTDLACDCGCGVPDYACGYHTPLYCINCIGCTEGDCDRLDPDDNSQCIQ